MSKTINKTIKRPIFAIAVPEITAKQYALINKMDKQTINNMCATEILPARKLNSNGEVIHPSERGTWWVNLVKLQEYLAKRDWVAEL